MSDQQGEAAGLVSSGERPYEPLPVGQPDSQLDELEPEPESRSELDPVPQAFRAHLAGVERTSSGAATLWLSDEITTMHFPLTEATVPALLEQLDQLTEARPRVHAAPAAEFEDDFPERDDPVAQDTEPVEENPGRLARWTGWHYSNSMVGRIPPQQRIAVFAAIVVILLLITIFH